MAHYYLLATPHKPSDGSRMADAASIVVRSFADSGVLITGGTSGVGLASAIQFAQAGVRRIGLIGRNAERGEQARKSVLAVCRELLPAG